MSAKANAIDVTLSMGWRQCIALIGLIRSIPAQIPGGARRLEVADKIVALEKTMPESVKTDRVASMAWRCELVLNPARVMINLAPADLRKDSVGLPIAMALLVDGIRIYAPKRLLR